MKFFDKRNNAITWPGLELPTCQSFVFYAPSPQHHLSPLGLSGFVQKLMTKINVMIIIIEERLFFKKLWCCVSRAVKQ